MRGLRLVTTEGEEGTRGEKVGGGGQERESGKMHKVYEKESIYYSSWFNLEHKLEFKIICATSGHTASQEAIALSKSVVQLMRWQLPSSGLAYDCNDGLVAINDVAAYLKVDSGLILAASSPEAGGGKMRTLVFEKKTGAEFSEQRITCLGGHGFIVHSPLGHMVIGQETAGGYTLYHETEKIRQIWESSKLCCMRCPGGVNFSLNKPGGYRRGVQTPIKIESADLVKAINEGFVFFENAFLRIVYGCGV